MTPPLCASRRPTRTYKRVSAGDRRVSMRSDAGSPRRAPPRPAEVAALAIIATGGLVMGVRRALRRKRSPGVAPAPAADENIVEWHPRPVEGPRQRLRTPLVRDSADVGGRTHFAAIGDYGFAGPDEEAVADMVKATQPEFIATLGDNNYPLGAADSIDLNIGLFYHDYIAPYVGRFGCGAARNRFFPALGNHDWMTADARPYLDYFALPGNERYYDVVWGAVHLFALDSDPSEPDGIKADSAQAAWLKRELAASTARWKIVYMHHAPYSSGPHGSVRNLPMAVQGLGRGPRALRARPHVRALRGRRPYLRRQRPRRHRLLSARRARRGERRAVQRERGRAVHRRRCVEAGRAPAAPSTVSRSTPSP